MCKIDAREVEMRMIRTFHSVGQGAFYSEVREDSSDNRLVVVYDCGSYSLGVRELNSEKNKRLRKKVHADLGKSASKKSSGNPRIDILYISHFDTDHINGCQFLDPKVVIIPFLSDEQINILAAINLLTDGDLQVDVLRHPELYFRGARIVRVRPESENNLARVESPVINISDEEDLNPLRGIHSLESGQSIKIQGENYEIWEYVPNNPNWDKFYSAFKCKVDSDKVLDYDQLNMADNGAYVISHMNELREIYDDMGDRNKHSLIVYSGPLYDIEHPILYPHPSVEYRYYNNYPLFDSLLYRRPACVYYGDIYMNSRWRQKYFKFLEDTNSSTHIGTLQIPHHGAWSSRGDLCIHEEWRQLCMISVCETNSYGHPSSRILSSILAKHCIPVLVTELAHSVLIEVVWL